jgi:hypothetical protein
MKKREAFVAAYDKSVKFEKSGETKRAPSVPRISVSYR